MEKPLIYFDIDKTMVDTTQLMLNGGSALAEIGLPESLFTQILAEYSATLKDKTEFNPVALLDKLTATSGIDREVIAATFWREENFAQALFPEVLVVIQALSAIADLGIFSQGVKDWQERKLLLSGLSEYFPEENRIIEANKLSEESVAKLPARALVVDDKKEVVRHLKSARNDIKVLWINRNLPEDNGLESITSLLEVLALNKITNPQG